MRFLRDEAIQKLKVKMMKYGIKERVVESSFWFCLALLCFVAAFYYSNVYLP